MSGKTYVEYLAGDNASHKRIMAKYGAGPVPRSYNGDTSLLNGAPREVSTVPASPPVFSLEAEAAAPETIDRPVQLELF